MEKNSQTPPNAQPNDKFSPQPDPAKKVVRRLMRLADFSPEDYSCEQAFEIIDQYAELAARGEDVSALMPLVKRHLELCPSCEDEYEALLNILNTDNRE